MGLAARRMRNETVKDQATAYIDQLYRIAFTKQSAI
jgi:hypothetical protein